MYCRCCMVKGGRPSQKTKYNKNLFVSFKPSARSTVKILYLQFNYSKFYHWRVILDHLTFTTAPHETSESTNCLYLYIFSPLSPVKHPGMRNEGCFIKEKFKIKYNLNIFFCTVGRGDTLHWGVFISEGTFGILTKIQTS